MSVVCFIKKVIFCWLGDTNPDINVVTILLAKWGGYFVRWNIVILKQINVIAAKPILIWKKHIHVYMYILNYKIPNWNINCHNKKTLSCHYRATKLLTTSTRPGNFVLRKLIKWLLMRDIRVTEFCVYFERKYLVNTLNVKTIFQSSPLPYKN